MTDVAVAKASSFSDPGRKVFDINGTEVGIFKLDGEFYAWENRCPHLDGPAVQGRLLPCYEEDLDDTGASKGRRFAKGKMNVVCPWHGFEFDIRTGRHPTNQAVRLKAVKFRLEGDDIVVSVRD